jgi:hypothetical protein
MSVVSSRSRYVVRARRYDGRTDPNGISAGAKRRRDHMCVRGAPPGAVDLAVDQGRVLGCPAMAALVYNGRPSKGWEAS